MTNTIVLTNKHLVDTTKNSTFQYDFPNSINFKDMELALVGGSMYYSWFNISADLMNTSFQYEYIDTSSVKQIVTVTLSEGLYEIADLNKRLQHSFIANDLYLIDSNGDYVYFAEFIINPTLYSCDINTYLIPTDLTGYTEPTGGFAALGGKLLNIHLSSKFNEILGFTADFESNPNIGDGSAELTSNNTDTSTSAPNVQPNSSVLVDCNLIDNPYGSPAGIISTIIPNVGLGALIAIDPNEHTYSPMLKGVFNSVRIRLLNKSTLQPLSIRDPQITLILGLRKQR